MPETNTQPVRQQSITWIIAAFAIVFIIAVTASYLSYINGKNAIFEQISATAGQTVNQWSEQLDMELERLEGVSQQVNFDPEIRKKLKIYDVAGVGSKEVIDANAAISTKLVTYATSNRYIYRIALVNSEFLNPETGGSALNMTHSHGSLIPSIDQRNRKMLEQGYSGQPPLQWVPVWKNGIFRKQDLDASTMHNYEGPTFTVMRKFTNFRTLTGADYLQVIQVKTGLLAKLFKNAKLTEESELFILSPEWNIIYSADEKSYENPFTLLPKSDSNLNRTIQENGVEYLIISQKTKVSKWHVLVKIPTAVLYEKVNQNLIWSIVIGVSLILLFLLTFLFIRRFQAVHVSMVNYSQELKQASDDMIILNKMLEHQSKELIRLDGVKDQIMANTSHELRTPLNGIIGIAESLLDGVSGPVNDLAGRNLRMIVVSGKRLLNLVNDILDFAKIRNHTLPLRLKAVNVETALRQTADFLKPLTDQKQLELIVRTQPDCPAVYADEDRLQQMLHNLLSNAIKFTEQGSIQLSARPEGPQVVIDVTDTGIGISDDQQKRIFRAFEQADGSTSRKYGGTGLGLSITKQLIELHGGKVTVSSEPGKGSTFSLKFPVPEPDKLIQDVHTAAVQGLPASATSGRSVAYEQFVTEQTAEPVVAAADSSAPSGSSDEYRHLRYRILVVDDEPINLQVIKNHLIREPYDLYTASDGQEAIRWMEEHPAPDLILLDVMMPGMSGYEVVKHIRKKLSVHQLPIMLLTAKNQPEDLVAAYDAGANDYLTKPIQKFELLARMRINLQLANWNHTMELTVAERSQSIRALLDYSEQGFLTIGPSLLVQPAYSKECESIFGGRIDNQPITDLLFEGNEQEISSFRSVISTVFDNPDAVNTPLILGLLPKEVTIRGHVIQILYKVMPRISGMSAQMMLILNEITEAKKLAEQVLKEQQRLRFVSKVVSSEQDILYLLHDFHQFSENEWRPPSVTGDPLNWCQTMLRTIHTFRGHFMQLSFASAAEGLWTIEEHLQSLINDQNLTAAFIQTWLNHHSIKDIPAEEIGILKQLFGLDWNAYPLNVKVNKTRLKEVEDEVMRKAADALKSSLVPKIRSLYFASSGALIGRYRSTVGELAERRGKIIPHVQVSGDALLLDPDRFRPFFDSLVHVFRNLVEHGLESAEEREESGKPMESVVEIRYTQLDSGGFELVIADDGRGIDKNKIRNRLLFTGHFPKQDISRMDDETLLQTIFMDGFSTSEQTDEMSGRGAGMSAVKAAAEQCGGTAEVQSEHGKGTRLIFRFPDAGLLHLPNPVH